jgi:hypothetical protein
MSAEMNDIRKKVILSGLARSEASRGVLDPLERMVLATTGSFKEMNKYRKLSSRIDDAKGQPMLLARFDKSAEPEKKVTLGTITGPPSAELEGPLGYLAVVLDDRQEWWDGSLRETPSNFEEDLIMTFAHDMGSGTRASEEFESRAIYENDWTLIGHREILGSQRARELFLGEVASFYEEIYSR